MPHLELQQQALRGLGSEHFEHQGRSLLVKLAVLPVLVVVLIIVAAVSPAGRAQGERRRRVGGVQV